MKTVPETPDPPSFTLGMDRRQTTPKQRSSDRPAIAVFAVASIAGSAANHNLRSGLPSPARRTSTACGKIMS